MLKKNNNRHATHRTASKKRLCLHTISCVNRTPQNLSILPTLLRKQNMLSVPLRWTTLTKPILSLMNMGKPTNYIWVLFRDPSPYEKESGMRTDGHGMVFRTENEARAYITHDIGVTNGFFPELALTPELYHLGKIRFFNETDPRHIRK